MFYIFLLCLIGSTVHTMEVQESSLFKKDLRLINVPVSGIYVQPDTKSSYDSQKIYGDWIEVVENIDEQWVKVQSDDEIAGYMQTADLISDTILWRTSQDLQRVRTLKGCVYPEPSAYNQTILKLPYNAYIKVLKISEDDNWATVELIDGTTGYIRTGEIELIQPMTVTAMIKRVTQFIGLPYIWGGASSDGYDCSGFIQLVARQLSYPMLRNSDSQVKDPNLIPVSHKEIQPGDFVYFGKDRISHVAFCIALNTIIHAAALGNQAHMMITNIDDSRLPSIICARRLPLFDYQSSIQEITQDVLPLIQKSWQENNPVLLKDLRLLTMKYWGYDDCVHTGQMVVHTEVAQEVVDIFGYLFAQRLPIERMKLIDEYDARDGFSCADNNSSAFCSRMLTNSKDKWSLHSFGIAIDINTCINPYYNSKSNYVGPVQGRPFIDRSLNIKGLIKDNDGYVNAFKKRGWKWAGDWQAPYGYVDYQHFYKEDGLSPELVALAQKYTPQL